MELTLNDTLPTRPAARLVRIAAAAGMAMLILAAAVLSGCQQAPKSHDADQPADPIPQLVKQADGTELMQLPAHMPGLKIATVRQVEQSGVLETSGKISFDDRRVAKIISRVAGRVEAVWVLQWDNVRAGRAGGYALQPRLHDRRGRIPASGGDVENRPGRRIGRLIQSGGCRWSRRRAASLNCWA